MNAAALDLVQRGPGCWEWLGRIDASEGYGRYGNGMAHRVVYELLVGPIPDGLVIDHLCRNRSCVNPDHLEPVTNRVNVLRGQAPSVQAWRENRCQKGHDFTPENTDHQRDGRRCKECRRERERKLRNAKRESIVTNPARDLAATGTPGPWHAVIDPDEPSDTPIADDNGYLCVSPDDGVRGGHSLADANKIVRAVNALPAIADLLDAIDAAIEGADAWGTCSREWVDLKRFAAARDAVAAALTGETP